MKLFFQYHKQHSFIPKIHIPDIHIPDIHIPDIHTSNLPIETTRNIPNPVNLGSMFQRVKYSETCHSCHGVK